MKLKKNVTIDLEYPIAVELKMWIQHMYDQQDDIVMSVEKVLSVLNEAA